MNQDPLSVSSKNHPNNQKIISKLLSEIYNQYHLDLSKDPVAQERIEEALQKARLELETTAEVEINLPYISANAAGPIHLVRLLTRADFLMADQGNDLSGEIHDPSSIDQESPPQRIRIELPERKPLVTTVLMVISVLIYIGQLLTVTDLTVGPDLLADLGMKRNELIISGQYWRLFTPIFLHGSIIHLGFNMYALNILGRRVERFFGSIRFLGLYIVAGITGNVFSFIFTSAPSLGSSTAIFGLLGAEGIFIYQHRKLFGEQFRSALKQIVQVAAINILIGLSPGIDNWGHIGGLIGGVVFTWFGGPLFSVINSPPLLKLEDQSSSDRVLLTFAVLIIGLIGLVILIIQSRM
jgi:rhomboid protease GluP